MAVDWFADDFGGRVHLSETGSWVRGAHGEELADD